MNFGANSCLCCAETAACVVQKLLWEDGGAAAVRACVCPCESHEVVLCLLSAWALQGEQVLDEDKQERWNWGSLHKGAVHKGTVSCD